MKVIIKLMDIQDARDIYDFEALNRAYFEENLPPREDEYFKPEVFGKIMESLIDEQNRGKCFMYIIRDETGIMVGRVNLFSVDKVSKSAELGYRIGKSHTGKGAAAEAARLALDLAANEHGLEKITAGTSAENIASQKVLEKNGFSFIEKIEKYIKVNGNWIDSLSYVKLL